MRDPLRRGGGRRRRRRAGRRLPRRAGCEPCVEESALHRLWYDLRVQSLFDESLRADVLAIDHTIETMVWRILSRYAELSGTELGVSSRTAYAIFDGIFAQAVADFVSGKDRRGGRAGCPGALVGTRDAGRRGDSMNRAVLVTGVGMIEFATPRHAQPYDVMARDRDRRRAGRRRRRLRRRSSRPSPATSTATRPAASALYGVGLTGIPVFNVNNNCSTGSTALLLARQAVGGRGRVRARASASSRWRRARSAEHWDDRPEPARAHVDAVG